MTPFTSRAIEIIKNIPFGTVMSYGEIAAKVGNPRSARQISRILHSMSDKYNLPWHRVVNSKGCISLKGDGYLKQRLLLESEGICFKENGCIYFKEL